MSECRRCSDCIGCDHHWLEELTYDADDDPLDAELIGDHVCKHCPVVGMTCDECDGEGGFGEIDEEDGEYEFDCPECIGRGIVVVHDVAADDEDDQ